MLMPGEDFNLVTFYDYMFYFASDENGNINSLEIYHRESAELLSKRPINFLPIRGKTYECFHDGKRISAVLSRGMSRGQVIISEMMIKWA